MIDYLQKQEIEASKYRCELLKLSKDQVFSSKIIDEEELQEKLAQKREVIVTAIPYMEQLIHIAKDCNFFALLTDEEGCILSALGEDKILGEAFQLKMVPGAYMSEEFIGTNAMSLVIQTKNPIQISGEDHYIKKYHQWSCSAAPIKDAKGNLTAVLDLTLYSNQAHPHTLGMVIAAANAIEELIQIKELNKAKSSMNKQIQSVFNAIPIAILTSDLEGNIKLFNNQVTRMFGEEDGSIKLRNMREIIAKWENLCETLVDGETVEQEISITALNQTKYYQMTANSNYNTTEDCIDLIYVFEKIKRVNRTANRTYDEMIGKNKDFLKVVQHSKKISENKSTILIIGESGTGKDFLAQSIHNYSKRKNGPFIVLNCGASPQQFIDIELFGYEDVVVPGQRKGGSQGKIEQADGGTLLLHEISELPKEMQIKLNKFLQDGLVYRMGSDKPIPVNVRVIATTKKDLQKEVSAGSFRNDLFYRLNMLPLYLPPLRKRKDDIEVLVDHFVSQISKKVNNKEVEISESFMELMKNYSWPGNIRELESVVELIVTTETISSSYFYQQAEQIKSFEEKDIADLETVEKEHISKVIKFNNGNISKTAEELGIRRNTLYSKLKKYEIMY